tara:strand:+ start:266 stop:499 length:234 start_codon:yes stop_codon:yes gene_type:complete
MKINNVGSNMTELVHTSGVIVLFSYSTPVAALLPSGKYVKTDRKYSVTTTKHINKWVLGNVETKPQSYIDELAGAVA